MDKNLINVSEITWSTISFSMKLMTSGNVEKLFVCKVNKFGTRKNEIKEEQKLHYSVADKSDDSIIIDINVTNSSDEVMFRDSLCLFKAIIDGREYFLTPSNELALTLYQKDRIFSYKEYRYSYNVSFNQLKIDEKNYLSVYFAFMIVNKKSDKRRIAYESNSKKTIIYNIASQLIKSSIFLSYKVLSFFIKGSGNNVLFMSQNKEKLSGNLSAISNRMIERGLDKEFNIKYSVYNLMGEEKKLMNWIKSFMSLIGQNYIFVDDYCPLFSLITLNKDVKLIQVWHAGIGFKSVGYARFGKDGGPHPFISGHRRYDYVVVGSDNLVKEYSEVFGISTNKFISAGLPRLDGYLNREKIVEYKSQFYKDYSIIKNKKVILFAPTFRGAGQNDAYYDFSQINFDEFARVCKNEYVVLFKFHPYVKEKIDIPSKYADIFFDFSGYNDINSLYYITDVLVTDFSSSIYEFSLFDKPILFFAYDRIEYEVSRAVTKTLDKNAPGKVCDTFEQLMNAIINEDYEVEKLSKYKKIAFNETLVNASDAVIKEVLNK